MRLEGCWWFDWRWQWCLWVWDGGGSGSRGSFQPTAGHGFQVLVKIFYSLSLKCACCGSIHLSASNFLDIPIIGRSLLQSSRIFENLSSNLTTFLDFWKFKCLVFWGKLHIMISKIQFCHQRENQVFCLMTKTRKKSFQIILPSDVCVLFSREKAAT